MKIICPECKKEIEFHLSDFEANMVFELITKDHPEIVKKLGEAAAKAYFSRKDNYGNTNNI